MQTSFITPNNITSEEVGGFWVVYNKYKPDNTLSFSVYKSEVEWRAGGLPFLGTGQCQDMEEVMRHARERIELYHKRGW